MKTSVLQCPFCPTQSLIAPDLIDHIYVFHCVRLDADEVIQKYCATGLTPFRRLLRCIECGFRHHNYAAFEDHEHLERPPRRDLSSFDEPPKGLVTSSDLKAALEAMPHENGDDERPSTTPPSTSPVRTMADVVKSLADIKVTETTQRDAGTHKLALQCDLAAELAFSFRQHDTVAAKRVEGLPFETRLFGDVVALGSALVPHFRLYFENVFPTGQYLIRDTNGKTIAEMDVFHQEMCIEHAYSGHSYRRENPNRRGFMSTILTTARVPPSVYYTVFFTRLEPCDDLWLYRGDVLWGRFAVVHLVNLQRRQ